MAKENQEKELETVIKADASVDVAVEKKEKKMVSETTQTLSASNLIKEFEKEQLKKELPEIYVGDTVKVGVKITEGNKERVQPYEGVVIAKRHGGINQTITVRRIFQGIGVERVFMLHSRLCSINTLSTPIPWKILLTVIVWLIPPCLFAMTTPS